MAPAGRRVRLPLPLLFSRRHSALTVHLWALLDVMGGPDRPVTAGREWLATRLSSPDRPVTVSGIAKALAALTRPHDGGPTEPDQPAWLVSRVRGRQLTAERLVQPGVPYVQVPEWTLGDVERGPLVSPTAWRFYALLVHKMLPRRAVVTLPAADLAALAHVRPDRVSALLRELEAAGMAVTAPRPGQSTVIAPVLDNSITGQLAAQAAADAELRATRTPVDNRRSPARDRCSHPPSPGTSPPPPAGTSPPPSPGTSTGEETYPEKTYKTPQAPGRAAPAGHAPADHRPTRTATSWCGRCLHPADRRRLVDGLPTIEPCPSCAPTELRWTA